MEPTKDQKYKTFTKEQKRFLYREISKEANEDYKRVSDNLKSYITNLIDSKLLTEDELFMKSRPYVLKTNRAILKPEDLGMDRNIEYPGHSEYMSGLEKSYYLDSGIPSKQDPTTKYRRIQEFSIGPRIMKMCSPEEINFICDALREVAMKYLEKEYFGLDTGWKKRPTSMIYCEILFMLSQNKKKRYLLFYVVGISLIFQEFSLCR